jgi:hypothetical protein
VQAGVAAYRLWRRLHPKPIVANEKDLFNTDVDWAKMGLRRRRIEDIDTVVGKMAAFEYFCKCGVKLTDGPRGGLSVNAVCHNCRTNYGCLPGYHGE